jgi:Protein of unknown function (DUF1523)
MLSFCAFPIIKHNLFKLTPQPWPVPEFAFAISREIYYVRILLQYQSTGFMDFRVDTHEERGQQMKVIKTITIVLVSLAAIAVIAFLHYNLQRTEVVKITGTDTKRVEKEKTEKISTDDTADSKVRVTKQRDVRYINTLTRKGKVMVFRNEDTGWGWPPYFKFNSADVTAKAQSYTISGKNPWVLVKFYGWRVNMFSAFPNLISMEIVEEDHRHLPLFNIIFLVLFFGAIFFVYRKGKLLTQRFGKRAKKQ